MILISEFTLYIVNFNDLIYLLINITFSFFLLFDVLLSNQNVNFRLLWAPVPDLDPNNVGYCVVKAHQRPLWREGQNQWVAFLYCICLFGPTLGQDAQRVTSFSLGFNNFRRTRYWSGFQWIVLENQSFKRYRESRCQMYSSVIVFWGLLIIINPFWRK